MTEDNHSDEFIEIQKLCKSMTEALDESFNITVQAENGEKVYIGPAEAKNHQYIIKVFETNADVNIRTRFIREIVFATQFSKIRLPILPIEAFCPYRRENQSPFILFKDPGGGFLMDSIEANNPQVQPNENFPPIDEKKPIELTPTIKMKIIYGLSFILSIIHQFNIIFRNLSPKFILLNEQGEPYLGGSDFTRTLEDGVKHLSAARGYPYYMSHELAANENVGLPSDIYALFAVICHLISGHNQMDRVDLAVIPNLNADNMKERHKLGHRIRVPDSISHEFQKVIAKGLHDDPKQRPTASEFCRLIREGTICLEGCDQDELTRYINSLSSGQPQISKSDFAIQYNHLIEELTDEYVKNNKVNEEEEEDFLEPTDSYSKLDESSQSIINFDP